MNLVVYTALIGRRDEIHPPILTNQTDVDFVCFTDEPTLVPSPWRPIRASWALINHDPVRAARWYKLNPHELFPSVDYSIWLDSTLQLTAQPHKIIEHCKAPISAFPHFSRGCIYDEADEVVLYALDDRELVYTQVRRFLMEGYPPSFGLHDTSFIVREHSDEVRQFNELWWETMVTGSRRDQLSFDYCLWRTGLECEPPARGWTRNPYDREAKSTCPLFAYRGPGLRRRPFMPWS